MAMRATTVRFTGATWGLLEAEAKLEGVSAAQFVRDATVMRIAYAMGRRGDDGLRAALAGVRPPRDDRSADDHASPDGVFATDRLDALRRTGLLDSPPTESFDRITRLTSELLSVPVALISLVDADRQVFKSSLGLAEPWASQRRTPLSHSFCKHVVASGRPLVVDDAREHPVVRDNPAIDDLGVVAYAGVPLADGAGHALGTLCAIDSRRRQWSSRQIALLDDLAGAARSEIALATA